MKNMLKLLGIAFASLGLAINVSAAQPAVTQPGLIASVVANAGTTGTTLNKLAKINSSGQAVISGTADTDKAVGIVISNAGTTGSAQIAYSGIANCVFDGATTAGNYVKISASVAGDCADTGGTTRPTGQTIGQVLSTNGGGGTYKVLLLLDAPSSTGSGVTSVTCNGGVTIITTTGTCASREILSASRQYEVRTDGNDTACTGLTNAAYVSGSYPQNCAFLTGQKGVDVASALDSSIYDVTIRFRTGAYNAAIILKSFIGSGTYSLVGDVTTPSNVSISVTGTAINAPSVVGVWSISGFKLVSVGGCIAASNGSKVNFTSMEFGSCTSSQVFASNGAVITASGSYTITGGGGFHLGVTYAEIATTGVTVTCSGSPVFSVGFVLAEAGGYVRAFASTYTGCTTGASSKRYDVSNGALIQTNGSGISYFPGTTAGTGTTYGTAPYGLYQ